MPAGRNQDKRMERRQVGEGMLVRAARGVVRSMPPEVRERPTPHVAWSVEPAPPAGEAGLLVFEGESF